MTRFLYYAIINIVHFINVSWLNNAGHPTSVPRGHREDGAYARIEQFLFPCGCEFDQYLDGLTDLAGAAPITKRRKCAG